MIPLIYWTYHKPKVIKGSIRRYVCGGKPNLLPTTLSRISRYATTELVIFFERDLLHKSIYSVYKNEL